MIIEDNMDAYKYLQSFLIKNYESINILGRTDNIKDSISFINKNEPELIFMDIELKDGLSFEIFKQLNYTNFEVIFISAYNNYINTALQHYAFSFITKPINEEILTKSINRYTQLKQRLFTQAKIEVLSSYLNKNNSTLLIKTGNEHILRNIDDVIKCSADGNYTIIKLKDNQEIIANNSLKHYEELLTVKNFFKINRSTLINIIHIKNIYKKETITLTNNDKVHVSFRNKANLSKLISLLS